MEKSLIDHFNYGKVTADSIKEEIESPCDVLNVIQGLVDASKVRIFFEGFID